MAAFFATAKNIYVNTTLDPVYFEGIIKWAREMDKVDEPAPKLPPAPEPPELDEYETVLATIVRNWVAEGLRAARRINHDPLSPHRPETARPRASTFDIANFDPLYWSAVDAIILRTEGGPRVRIITLTPAKGTCGIERHNKLIPEESYTMKTIHGWLQPVGKVQSSENPTDRMTVVLTHEGQEIGWVVATGYPGLPDPQPKENVRQTLKEGDIFTGTQLIEEFGFETGVPEE